VDWLKESLAAVVTVVSLIGFTILAIYLLKRISSNDLAWSRRVYVFSAVEAIAFAAVGWLFGKEVHREQAQAAERRATDAESRADTANAETREQAQEMTVYQERARALKQAIMSARATGTRERAAARGTGIAPPDQAAGPAPELDALADLAERLHPEV
jgi:LPS sulfotransferase NodH